MKTIFIMLLLLIISACSSKIDNNNLKIVTFDTSLKCADCVDKMFNNLPKEEGVIDLEVSYDEKEVTLVFNPDATSVDRLAGIINELGYSAYVKNLDDYRRDIN